MADSVVVQLAVAWKVGGVVAGVTATGVDSVCAEQDPMTAVRVWPPFLAVWLNATVAPLLIWLLTEVTVAVRVIDCPATGGFRLPVRVVAVLLIGSSSGFAHCWVVARWRVLDEDDAVRWERRRACCSGSC